MTEGDTEIARLTAELNTAKRKLRDAEHQRAEALEAWIAIKADLAAARAALEFYAKSWVQNKTAVDALSRLGTGESLQVVREAQKILRGDVSAAEYEGEEDTAAKDVLTRLKAVYGE